MPEFRQWDRNAYIKFLSKTSELFQEILQGIQSRIQAWITFRNPLDTGLKFAVTLRHLASTDNYHSLQFNFRVARGASLR